MLFAKPIAIAKMSLRAHFLRQLLFGALGTDDVVSVGDEATTYERGVASSADEAIVVPVPVLERNEARTADSCQTHLTIRSS